MEPLVSVVVPVYNAEDFLKDCINSILNQTFDNFEVLLINDGSHDRSWGIIEEFMLKDGRIRGINKNNEGVSSARNLGIQEAKGKYIQFVDADDTIKPTMLSTLINEFTDEVDLVICGFQKKTIHGIEVYNVKEDLFYTQKELINQYYSLSEKFVLYTPCTNMYKKNIILQQNILFNVQLTLGEDVLFNLEYIKHVRNVKILSSDYYEYNCLANNNSLTKKYDAKLLGGHEIFFRKNIEFCEFYDICTDENIQLLFRNYLNGILSTIGIFLRSNEINKKIKLYKILGKVDNRIYQVKDLNLKEKIFLYFMKKRLYWVIYVLLNTFLRIKNNHFMRFKKINCL